MNFLFKDDVIYDFMILNKNVYKFFSNVLVEVFWVMEINSIYRFIRLRISCSKGKMLFFLW